MPPVTVGYATSGRVQQLHRTGYLGNSMAFGLAVEDFGTKPVAEIATGATPPVCTAAKPTSGLSRENTFYLPGKGWCCKGCAAVLPRTVGITLQRSRHGTIAYYKYQCPLPWF